MAGVALFKMTIGALSRMVAVTVRETVFGVLHRAAVIAARGTPVVGM